MKGLNLAGTIALAAAVHLPVIASGGLASLADVERLLRLDVPAALVILGEVFPAAVDPAADRDFVEPRGDRASVSYRREHEAVFKPLAEVFSLLREIGTAVTHSVGAYG